MVPFRSTLLALASAIVVSADYYIDPTSVPLSTRMAWCNDETSTCPLICQQTYPNTVEVNTCDPETLTYGCLCGNGLQPNISEYSLTLPFHVCQQWGVQCVQDCNGDNSCASHCQQDHPCGAQNPTKANVTTTATLSATASASASTTANQIFTAPAGSQATDSSSAAANSGASQVLAFGRAYGLIAIGSGLFVGFATML
ncbi:hypothetical protein B0T19DRAFT_453435 [Cercophora scortea]|uniref:DUF7707 domain-containing protein n=1 Tax=Cercophora scortea TaxID=314031 RepID=A0AAE0J3A3_9PEZI|nr:hypothetical protein B0T19DRAFT_453435 [Cercophora scortea]